MNNLKFDKFGNLNRLDTVFTKIAKNQFTTDRYSKEWKILIIIVLLFDFVASFLSVYAGYFYLSTLLIPMFESKIISIASTIAILILLELLVHFLLAKFFKFALKYHVQTAIFLLFAVTSVFLLSFQLSTQGLSINESAKVSKVELITDNLDTEVNNLELETKQNIDFLRNEINTIKSAPQGWINGKRSILTAKQLQDIKDYNAEINKLRQALRTQTKELENNAKNDKESNLKEVTSTANKYYVFISIIMLIEIISSMFLMYSWSKIQMENDPETHTKSRILDISLQVDNSITQLYNERFNAMNNALQIALQSNYNSSIPLEFSRAENNQGTVFSEAEIMNKNNVGFKMQNTTTGQGSAKTKVCNYCNAYLIDMHPAAKYCNAECRKQAWELKSGVKLQYKSKKR